MTRLLNNIIGAICVCSAMRLWQYYVGVRLAIADVFVVIFLVLFSLWTIWRRKIPTPISELRPLALGMVLIWVLSIFSVFSIDSSLGAPAFAQYSKGLAHLTLHIFGLSALMLHLSGTSKPEETAKRYLKLYILGAVASSVYSFFEVGLAYGGIDLGKIVFGTLSTYPPDFDRSAHFYYEWDIFFRAVGFPGVNAQATYTASVIPVLLIARPFSRSAVNYLFAALCFAGTSLTLSRNGFFSLFFAFSLYSLMRPDWIARLLPKLVLISIPVVVFAVIFWEPVNQVVSTRLYSSLDQIGSGRWEVYQPTWQTVKSHPFGHGLNQFSVVIQNTDEIDLSRMEVLYFNWTETQLRQAYANLHNNWLNWLFEGGWPLFSAYIAYYVSVILICLRSKNTIGRAAVCAITGLAVSGFFNMTLDQLSTELFVVLAACCAVYSKQILPSLKAEEHSIASISNLVSTQ